MQEDICKMEFNCDIVCISWPRLAGGGMITEHSAHGCLGSCLDLASPTRDRTVAAFKCTLLSAGRTFSQKKRVIVIITLRPTLIACKSDWQEFHASRLPVGKGSRATVNCSTQYHSINPAFLRQSHAHASLLTLRRGRKLSSFAVSTLSSNKAMFCTRVCRQQPGNSNQTVYMHVPLIVLLLY